MPVGFDASFDKIYGDHLNNDLGLTTEQPNEEPIHPHQKSAWRAITAGAICGGAIGSCAGVVIAVLAMRQYALCNTEDVPEASCFENPPPDLLFLAGTAAGSGVGALVQGVNHAFSRLFAPRPLLPL